MITKPERRLRRTAFEEAVALGIRQRTCNRVETLEVEVIGNRVIIRGCTTSYHLKQLAIQGVRDVIDANLDSSLEIDMQVVVVARVAEVELN